MSQILHIFLKDARRFWGEIFLSVAITAIFAWFYPNTWLGPDQVHHAMGNHAAVNYELQAFGELLIVLVPITWWLLIARVVHAETLVGDRQFWLTRPYEWPKLLAAKFLFLLAFLDLPIFIAQCALLAEAGFNPFSFIPGLLYNLMLLSVVIVLPIFALSTVTSNFARMTLTILGVFLGVVFLGFVVTHLTRSHHTAVPNDSLASALSAFFSGLAFVVCAVVILLQYAQRRVWLARTMLYGIPALLLLASPLTSGIETHHPRIDQNYPVNANTPFQLDYHPLMPGQFPAFETYPDTGEVVVRVPLEATGVASGTVLVPDAVKLEVEAPDGTHWTSEWEGTAMPKFFADTRDGDAEIPMPHAIYQQLKTMPLTLHLSVAMTVAKTASVTQIDLPDDDFSVPGFGVCTPDSMFLLHRSTNLTCRSALREPPLTYIGVVWSDNRCDAQPPTPEPGVQGAAWIGSLDRAPADLNISSVHQVVFFLTNNFRDQHSEYQRYLCPGSPVTFTQYQRTGRNQTCITIHDFKLPGIPDGNGALHFFRTPETTTTTVTPAQK